MPQLTGEKREIIDPAVAMIGHSYGCFHEVAFLSDANFYEYSTIILDPQAIDAELNETGGPPFGRAAHRWITIRSEQLMKWLVAGHNLILLVRRPSHWSFEFRDQDGYPFSQQFSLYDLPMFGFLDFHRTTGNRVDFAGRPILKALIEPHLSHFEYEAVVSGHDLEPILQVRTSAASGNQLVGCRTQFDKGQLICMPPIGVDRAQAQFLEMLSQLPRAMVPQSVRLPDWVDSFCSDSELSSRKTIDALVEKIQSLELRLSDERNEAARLRKMKSLFAGSGEEFKDAVKGALLELGLKCADGPHPRADLLATDGERFMAIEAKGLDGNARETNFRQVERWKSEVNLALTLPPDERDADPDLKRYAELLESLAISSGSGEACKGLMLIGTFRATPLSDRRQPDFPESVIRLLTQTNVCALTGLQLFGLLSMARADPSLKEKIVSSLFATAGVLDLATDWRQFLREDGQQGQALQ